MAVLLLLVAICNDRRLLNNIIRYARDFVRVELFVLIFLVLLLSQCKKENLAAWRLHPERWAYIATKWVLRDEDAETTWTRLGATVKT